MVSSGLTHLFHSPATKYILLMSSHPFHNSSSVLWQWQMLLFEFILTDCLWEAKHPQMSAVVLSDFLRQSDKFGTDSES